MDISLRQYGNSKVVVIPSAVISALGLEVNQVLSMTLQDGKMILQPKRSYTLDDMVNQCDPKAKAPLDMALWAAATPVGRESA